MQQYKSILIYGFAIFAMFFGSGNLVFPLQIGQASGNQWLMGFSGLLLTGILLPLMGLFVIKIYRGDYHAFFASAGKLTGIFLPLIMLSLLGSFGVVPRCITVSFGSICYLFPNLPLHPFSFIFCFITFFCCLNDKKMVKILGQWMSPILLISLLTLIAVAYLKAPEIVYDNSKFGALSHGFTTGYQTMDLFAAFFFSALIFSQIQQQFPEAKSREILLFAIKSSILGATLLALIYFGFVFLGAHYASLITGAKPELILPGIAAISMGKYATFFIGIAMFFSCLTTAVALNNLYARYLCTLIPGNRNYFLPILFATTFLSFIISLLDFKGISAFLAPILQLTYPGIIALTVMALFIREQKAFKQAVFYTMTLCMCVPLAIH